MADKVSTACAAKASAFRVVREGRAERDWDVPPASNSFRARIKALSPKGLALLAAPIVILLMLGLMAPAGAFDPLFGRLAQNPAAGRQAATHAGLQAFVDLSAMIVDRRTANDQPLLLRVSYGPAQRTPVDKAGVRQFLPPMRATLGTNLRALEPNDLKGTAQGNWQHDEMLQRIALAFGAACVKAVFFRDLLVR